MEGFVLGGMARSPRARRILRDLEKGVIHESDAWRAVLEENVSLAWLQVGAGLTVVSDPVIEWHDLFRPFAESWRGCFPGGLLRFFDNNFFYRVPTFLELPSPTKPVLAPRVRALVERLPRWVKLKVVLPGPITFARMSKAPPGVDFGVFVEELAKVLREEARLAIEAGARVIEVDEPWLCDVDASRSDAELATELFRKYFANLGAETVLATYFSPPTPSIWEVLANAGASYVTIDVVDSPKRAREALEKAVPEGVALGVVQARDLLDPPLELVKEFARLCEERGAKRVALTTSAWLDLLPFDASIEKVIKLGRLLRALSGG